MANEKMTIHDQFIEVIDFLKEVDAPQDMVDFMESRADMVAKASENAKAARIKKNGGVQKDVAQSDFYVTLRDKIYKVLSTDPQTGDELLSKIDNITPNGKAYLAAQVAVALKPLIADGTVKTGEKKVAYVNKKGLNQESFRNAYSLA